MENAYVNSIIVNGTETQIQDYGRDQPNGVPVLDTQGKLPIKYLPDNVLSAPVDVVQDGNMHAVTSNAVAQSLVALRTNFGFKIGNLMIEMISISKDGVIFSSGRVSISNPYNFSAPFTVPPTVILNSQSYEDYGYSTPIGIVRTKSGITTLCLFRDKDGAHNIRIEGIAIGV